MERLRIRENLENESRKLEIQDRLRVIESQIESLEEKHRTKDEDEKLEKLRDEKENLEKALMDLG